MSEERFIDLETRLAHQDQAIHELNQVVVRQEQAIADLERLCRSLAERVSALGDDLAAGAARGADERPPHY